MTEKVLSIGGMSCGHCLMAVRSALEGVEGAQVKEVRLGSATVGIDESVVAAEALAEAVRDAGYDVLEVR